MNPRPQGLLAAVASMVIAVSASAELYVPQGGGASLAPLRSEEIVMESERVLVEQNTSPDSTSRASAVYRMRNETDRTIVTRVAFPFRESYHHALAHGNFKVTVVDAAGAESEPICEQIRPHEVDPLPYNFAAAYVWPVTWAPRETKTIHVTYSIGEMNIPEFFVDGWRLSYLVSTGAFWKGPIEDAEFTFRFAKIRRRGERCSIPFSQARAAPTSSTRVTPTRSRPDACPTRRSSGVSKTGSPTRTCGSGRSAGRASMVSSVWSGWSTPAVTTKETPSPTMTPSSSGR